MSEKVETKQDWNVILVFKRFSEGKEPKQFQVLENGGAYFISMKSGKDKSVVMKLTDGEIAELGAKMLGIALRR